MTEDLKAQVLEALLIAVQLDDASFDEEAVNKCEAAITLLQDPNVFVGRWEMDAVLIKRDVIEDLWSKAQAIGYHAQMDTLKGKRRGRWIEPIALEVIEILEYYRAGLSFAPIKEKA